MIFALSALVMTSALFLVLVVSRLIERPGAPHWLQAACRSNTMALIATVIYAMGLGGALQAAFDGGLHSLWALALSLAAPFVVLWYVARATRSGGETAAEAPIQPGGSRPRAGRTGTAAPAGARRGMKRAA